MNKRMKLMISLAASAVLFLSMVITDNPFKGSSAEISSARVSGQESTTAACDGTAALDDSLVLEGSEDTEGGSSLNSIGSDNSTVNLYMDESELISGMEPVLGSPDAALGESLSAAPEVTAAPVPTAALPTSAPLPTSTPVPTATPTPVTFAYAVSKVDDYVKVRTSPSTDADVAGRLYADSYGKIVGREDGWTEIESGDVTGYVNNEYLYLDGDAIDYLEDNDSYVAKINANKVNIRAKASTDADVVGVADEGDKFTLLPLKSSSKWAAIKYDGSLAYISMDFVTKAITLDKAVSTEQIEEKERKEALKKAMEEAKKYTPESTNRAAVDLSDDELFLLATVVQMEAGSESYEGKLAVANVIINRLLNGSWGNTVYDVVHAPGQFSGANSGRIEEYSSKVSSSCKKAAVEAAAGNNNIGSYLYFRMVSGAPISSYSKYYILGNHVFH